MIPKHSRSKLHCIFFFEFESFFWKIAARKTTGDGRTPNLDSNVGLNLWLRRFHLQHSPKSPLQRRLVVLERLLGNLANFKKTNFMNSRQNRVDAPVTCHFLIQNYRFHFFSFSKSARFSRKRPDPGLSGRGGPLLKVLQLLVQSLPSCNCKTGSSDIPTYFTAPASGPAPAMPQKALCGGIPCPFLEPLARSWSHFVGIYRQNLTRSLDN